MLINVIKTRLLEDLSKAPVFPEYGRELRDKCLELMLSTGLVLEFGVFTGITITQIANKINPRTVYGFDWFRGLPEVWDENNAKGKFDLAGVPPEVPHNVILIKGLVQDTLFPFLKTHTEHISFIHMDLDLYNPTVFSLNCLHKMFITDTIIFFDEFFNYPTFEDNEFRAFVEFLSLDETISYEIIGVSSDTYSQAAFKIKKKG